MRYRCPCGFATDDLEQFEDHLFTFPEDDHYELAEGQELRCQWQIVARKIWLMRNIGVAIVAPGFRTARNFRLRRSGPPVGVTEGAFAADGAGGMGGGRARRPGCGGARICVWVRLGG
jgi:hypothetical protein